MNLIIPNGFERNFTLGFIRGLTANRVPVLVLSDDEIAPALDDAGVAHVNVRGSVSEDRSPWQKTRNLLRSYARLFWLLWKYRGATMHFTGMFQNRWILFEGMLLNGFIRWMAGRYLYTVHNVLPHGQENSRFYRWIYHWIYRPPHVLLTHTQTARRQLIEEFGVPVERIHVTSIGLNEEMPLTELTVAAARQRLGLAADQRVILFFGKIDEYKGLDLLLDAFERLAGPEFRLIIAGMFRSIAYRRAIRRQCETMRRRADVSWQERFIHNEEAEIFFKASDVLCLPYRHIYQSGLVFLGPRFGLPLVTTDVGSLREFVEEGGLGLVSDSNDSAGLAATLEKFFTQPDRFRREAIMAAASKYRWEEVCRAILPLYFPGRTVPTELVASPANLARSAVDHPRS